MHEIAIYEIARQRQADLLAAAGSGTPRPVRHRRVDPAVRQWCASTLHRVADRIAPSVTAVHRCTSGLGVPTQRRLGC